jgi:hypothetical protein
MASLKSLWKQTFQQVSNAVYQRSSNDITQDVRGETRGDNYAVRVFGEINSVDPSGEAIPQSVSKKLTSGNITYFGYAEPGTETTGEAAWVILRITDNGNNSYDYEWAEGLRDSFTLNWDDRATYDYKY